MRSLHAFWAVLVLFTAAACEQETGFVDPIAASEVEALVPSGSPAGVGILRLLNDESTTFEVLDDDVGLDRRAALGLVHHRNGPDGVYGTRDDAKFYDLDDVDSVKWVGDTALVKLMKYADQDGWVPMGDDELGVYDTVPFTVFEADEVLELVNFATEKALDDAVRLDRRAVDSIMAARPIDSVRALSELPYVGRSALVFMKRHAPNFFR